MRYLDIKADLAIWDNHWFSFPYILPGILRMLKLIAARGLVEELSSYAHGLERLSNRDISKFIS